MERPPSIPDLNPIENLWSIVKQKLYEGGKPYNSKVNCTVFSLLHGVINNYLLNILNRDFIDNSTPNERTDIQISKCIPRCSVATLKFSDIEYHTT
ncbi:Hypothetical predicted protein [Octopus vulgaris]|uniref:Tc1-like transposase DDE domain-containing protein n=1 Tax=Octopus vulgaris TaxID=6645 RepID=A0AA36ATF2_OCTVU|nr:Hypothetical predicted protein [Octopus vulgaris]